MTSSAHFYILTLTLHNCLPPLLKDSVKTYHIRSKKKHSSEFANICFLMLAAVI